MAKPDTAGVIAPPPLIFLTGLLVGYGLEYLSPSLSLSHQEPNDVCLHSFDPEDYQRTGPRMMIKTLGESRHF